MAAYKRLGDPLGGLEGWTVYWPTDQGHGGGVQLTVQEA